MPVRFRCPFCNQLLGISRRKIGTVIECPNCHGKVGVPSEEPGPVDPAPPPPPPAPAGALDFGAAPAYSEPPPSPPIVPFAPAPSEPSQDYVLSVVTATLLTVAAFVLLALAFGVGLLVGRNL
jgi:hypothetical protein